MGRVLCEEALLDCVVLFGAEADKLDIGNEMGSLGGCKAI